MADVSFRDMGEVADFLRNRMDELGLSVRAACARAQVNRNALYQITERATALGAESMARLCDSLSLSPDEKMAVLRAWFRARVGQSALAGPFEVALEVIDALPARRRAEVWTRIVEAYDDGRGTTRPVK